MGKVLMLLVAVGVLVWMLTARARPRGDAATPPPARRKPSGPEAMVACAHCGAHLPRSEAVTAGAQTYCSPAHRDLGPRRGR